MSFRSLEWIAPATLRMLDQRKLPTETIYNDYETYAEVAQAIRDMVTRGAPAIAVAASYGLALTAVRSQAADVDALKLELATAMDALRASRPTAVNLFWAMDRMEAMIADPNLDSVDALKDAVLAEAHAIFEEDVEINKSIGRNAMPLVPEGATIIHHCNTGSLATVDYGTALGIIRMAHEEGKNIFALLDETRPRLQGGRLSAYELKEQGVPFKVIVDGASGHFMRRHGVDLCVVGADRVAANGDTANKIGTYNLAVVAHENNVPFYVAAPTTTIDMATKHGDEIEIEERPASEITHVRECQITPDDIEVGNPAFDVTPSKYITAIITEKGVVYPPFDEGLMALMG
ncbi:MAG: S-methyl-5-thioribose-1-phosphate isomerase [Anaerolineae bacterium]|jgi:methylthioribose-1-phosphate isomerase|nr:S-methyl-5-thioribose-1-phosphate isomerase [Anaerolineae bacterium]MBT7192184.1 S-methyl-5-thioribose-1-phosphate isomerase [Anaerolineae bacterium]MBT7990660.1 S-methyl-5-thioribose-1-phosphate isomerase [Anaerolineae bacterium]